MASVLSYSRARLHRRRSSARQLQKVNGDPHFLFLPRLTVTLLAIRAYKQAIHTLSALAAHPSPYEHLHSTTRDSNSNSIFSSFLPNLQGQGPIGSAVRILGRIQQQIFHGILGGDRDGIPFPGSRRKEEEMHRKAIKVVDLLQHSAELGNMDALYTLAQISLVSYSDLNPYSLL